MTPQQLIVATQHLKEIQRNAEQAIEFNKKLALTMLPFLLTNLKQFRLILPPIMPEFGGMQPLASTVDKQAEFQRYKDFVLDFCEMFDLELDSDG